MLFPQPEQNERFRARRASARRRRRRRRAAILGVLLVATVAVAAGARVAIDEDGAETGTSAAAEPADSQPRKPAKPPRALPAEVRGVHVTMGLASLDGKLAEYLELADGGLNTLELDVKDENGEIGFVPSAVPLAKKVGAARPYYRPRQVAKMVHARGIYLIGRVV